MNDKTNWQLNSYIHDLDLVIFFEAGHSVMEHGVTMLCTYMTSYIYIYIYALVKDEGILMIYDLIQVKKNLYIRGTNIPPYLFI